MSTDKTSRGADPIGTERHAPARSAAIRFDVQLYGEGGGVMAAYRVDGEGAEAVARSEAERLRGYPQAATVGVWAFDRRSGNAQAKVRHA